MKITVDIGVIPNGCGIHEGAPPPGSGGAVGLGWAEMGWERMLIPRVCVRANPGNHGVCAIFSLSLVLIQR